VHTTVEPAGTTTVCEFGGGEESLLLNEMQPARVSKCSNTSVRAKSVNVAMRISKSGRAVADAGVRTLAFPFREYR
jgi:hypothetical protein